MNRDDEARERKLATKMTANELARKELTLNTAKFNPSLKLPN